MVKITAAVIATAAAAAGFLTTATAAADQGASTTSHAFGSQATLADGDVVRGWRVHDLKPSTDTIAYQPHGTLWEVTTTDIAAEGHPPRCR